VVTYGKAAPNLVSTLNIGAFNVGNALGAWIGGSDRPRLRPDQRATGRRGAGGARPAGTLITFRQSGNPELAPATN
jgi:DHA1 family inner membrane transport protein